MLVTWLKNFIYRGCLVAVDTDFTVSAIYVESLLQRNFVEFWGAKLRDGVLVFYVAEKDAEHVKHLFLRHKILAVVVRC